MRNNIPIAMLFGFGFWMFLAQGWRMPMGICVLGAVCFIIKELYIVIKEINNERDKV